VEGNGRGIFRALLHLSLGRERFFGKIDVFVVLLS